MNVTFIHRHNLAKCDALVNEAMNLFWNSKGGDGRWHFFGTSVIEKIRGSSQDSLK